MHKNIAQLLVIQEKEQELRTLEDEKNDLPKMLDNSKAHLGRLEEGVQEARDELKQAQVRFKDLELESGSKLENIAKLEAQLFTIKNNTDYKAMEKEIADRKIENERLEDKMLEVMEDIEAKKKVVSEGEQLVKDKKADLAAEQKKVEQQIAKLDGEIAALKEQRDKLLPTVSEDVLRKYKQIFNKKRDTAVVPLIDYTCGGCHMQLPPQTANNVRKANELVICDNCSRILYWPEGVDKATAQKPESKTEDSAGAE
jgi:predicted  nucleic acid-binding Zn-ribbon protein